MHFYKRWNNITGWAVFAVAAMVYLMTMEPVSSLWDCSEFIATSYKLEVGHPPGAPLFMMLARVILSFPNFWRIASIVASSFLFRSFFSLSSNNDNCSKLSSVRFVSATPISRSGSPFQDSVKSFLAFLYISSVVSVAFGSVV